MENNNPELESKTKSELSSVSVLVTKAYNITFGKNFWKFIGIIISVFVLAVAVGAIAALVFFSTKASVVAIIFAVILCAVFLYMVFWMNTTMIFAVDAVMKGEEFTIIDSYKKSRSRVPVFIGSSFVVILIMVAWFILPTIVIAFNQVIGAILFVAMLVPAVWFSVLYSQTKYISTCEKMSVMETLRKSKIYTKKYFGPLVGRQLSLCLIMIVASLLVGGISMLIPILGLILRLVYDVLIVPFSVIYSFLIYVDLKKMHEELGQ